MLFMYKYIIEVGVTMTKIVSNVDFRSNSYLRLEILDYLRPYSNPML
jgi:hypothetical protein